MEPSASLLSPMGRLSSPMPTTPRRTERSCLSASVSALCIPSDRVKEVWAFAKGMIADAMHRGALGCFEDVEQEVLAGKALLWIAWDGFATHASAVTRIDKIGSDKVCIIVACGGRAINNWIGCLDMIEQYASAEGCRKVRIYGRPGWQRVLKQYEPFRVVLDKVL